MTYACNYVCWKTLLFLACGHRPRIWNLWWTLCFRLTQNSFTVWSVVSGIVSGRHFLCLSLTLAGFWLFVKLSNLKLHIALLNTWGLYFFPYFQLQVHPCVVALWAAQRRCWLGKRDITLDPWAFQLPIGTQRNLRLRFCLRSTFEENCSISVAVWAFTENVDVSFVFFKADVPWIAKTSPLRVKIGMTRHVVYFPNRGLLAAGRWHLKPPAPPGWGFTVFLGASEVVHERCQDVSGGISPDSCQWADPPGSWPDSDGLRMRCDLVHGFSAKKKRNTVDPTVSQGVTWIIQHRTLNLADPWLSIGGHPSFRIVLCCQFFHLWIEADNSSEHSWNFCAKQWEDALEYLRQTLHHVTMSFKLCT